MRIRRLVTREDAQSRVALAAALPEPGRERGEVLRVVRDEQGVVTRLYWATYPFTRTPEIFGTSPEG